MARDIHKEEFNFVLFFHEWSDGSGRCVATGGRIRWCCGRAGLQEWRFHNYCTSPGTLHGAGGRSRSTGSLGHMWRGRHGGPHCVCLEATYSTTASVWQPSVHQLLHRRCLVSTCSSTSGATPTHSVINTISCGPSPVFKVKLLKEH